MFKITRFNSSQPPETILQCLSSILNDFLVSHKLFSNSISFSTVDKRKCLLNGDIKVQPVGSLNLVLFNRRKGDPVEFTRFFCAVKQQAEAQITILE